MTVFETVHVETFAEIIPLITEYAWSPIVWYNGKRVKTHFSFAGMCALDFDNGVWTLATAVRMLRQNFQAGIIAPTRSHQIEKDGKPACDRFRLIMPWDTPCGSLDAYEQNMKRLTGVFPVDPACKDGARFFWPCTSVYYQQTGVAIQWQPYIAPRPHVPTPGEAYDRSLHIIPQWMRNELENGIVPGKRNQTVFRFAIHLKRRGFCEAEVREIFGRTIDLDTTEIARTVSSAFRTS